MAASVKVSVARNVAITAEECETQLKIPYRFLVKISHSQFNRISLSPGCLALEHGADRMSRNVVN